MRLVIQPTNSLKRKSRYIKLKQRREYIWISIRQHTNSSTIILTCLAELMKSMELYSRFKIKFVSSIKLVHKYNWMSELNGLVLPAPVTCNCFTLFSHQFDLLSTSSQILYIIILRLKSGYNDDRIGPISCSCVRIFVVQQ